MTDNKALMRRALREIEHMMYYPPAMNGTLDLKSLLAKLGIKSAMPEKIYFGGYTSSAAATHTITFEPLSVEIIDEAFRKAAERSGKP